MTRLSRRPHDVAAVRAFLIDVAGSDPSRPLPTYGDVASAYGGIARAVAPVLNSVAEDCRRAGEPDLSALVVNKASGFAGSFDGAPVVEGARNEESWLAESDRIRRHPWAR